MLPSTNTKTKLDLVCDFGLFQLIFNKVSG